MRLMKRMVVLTMTLTLAMATLPSIKRGKVSSQSDRDSPKFVPGEIVVKYKSRISEVEKQSARGRALGHRKMLLHPDDGDGEMELVEVPNHMSVEAALSNLKDDPAVSYAEPNWIYTHTETSNDPFYTNGSLWGMYGNSTTPANQFGSQAGEAWAAGHVGSDDVYVGVIDEGIDLNHPDLAANIWTNPFDPVDGLDNDGNGFVDDIHGWDFAGNNNSIYDGTGDDHGTHVAGTIGAIGGNGAGVAGVNWNVTLISGKFLGASGGTSANAVRAVNYFTDLKTRHNLNIVATNNSWGGGGYSQALHDAIIRAAKAGILFIAAAGNAGQNNDATPFYPANYNTSVGTSTESAASYDAVISVASITSSGARSSFSNYGQTTVDLGAPGSGIFSTTPNGNYSSFSGTSMATPHVTGAVALYRSVNINASASNTKSAILESAINTPTSSLNDITTTDGRLNIGFLLGGGTPPPPSPPSIPAVPTNLSAEPRGSRRIRLTWEDNSNNETRFEFERRTSSTSFVFIGSVGANATSATNSGLSPDTTYTYRMRACNANGCSGYSNEATGTTN